MCTSGENSIMWPDKTTREYGKCDMDQSSMASLFRGVDGSIAITAILLYKFLFTMYYNCKNMINQPLKYLRLNHTIMYYSIL